MLRTRSRPSRKTTCMAFENAGGILENGELKIPAISSPGTEKSSEYSGRDEMPTYYIHPHYHECSSALFYLSIGAKNYEFRQTNKYRSPTTQPQDSSWFFPCDGARIRIISET
ncbi:predicted protein [Uncinocarpus reesii 1704]|uniref:Uncharacterized protein n=1 Tax=Uncinocarpus reesii (strain UAMH 1704) TaxID=336963 RepID=C4JZ73_UNCRE|nr:uncharacterized protein UREG_07474 [Uncinocarpus reesii 1704]EEP82609.1 predicted protein [Uncinocarpus reesii 1704]